MVEPNYHSSPQHLSPQLGMSRQAPHSRRISLESQALLRAASRSLSPHPEGSLTGSKVSFNPPDRSLPSRDVSPESISDAFAAFILYCNPNFALDVDTSTLKTNFSNPPKSGHKDFQTYHLLELLGKFDSKEIKTWGQLALDLGVEAPDVSKGQSVQKVQQYTVRLKRWMRALHVDAFSDYLLGKAHSYFTDIPNPTDPYPPNGRDGVTAEEDLAIRALDPSFRPKRGRRRNSDAEQEAAEMEAIASAKRARMTDEAGEQFNNSQVTGTTPFSARPGHVDDPWAVASAVTPETFAPWASKRNATQSMSSAGPSQLRWQINGSAQTPLTPHPLTAHPGSMNDSIESAFENEPKSAITPSTRKRRKHGPAVSSAWPSSNGFGAKPRGRPPASRSTQVGPYSTFPADPANDKSSGSTSIAPVASMDSGSVSTEQALQLPSPGDAVSKRARLSLQVPAHTGGPVRLATPPRVLVTPQTDDLADGAAAQQADAQASARTDPRIQTQGGVHYIEREMPGFMFEALKRILASDLLRAQLSGRRHRLTGDEAKRLADAMLERFNVPRADTKGSRDDIARLTTASWLGLGDQLHVPLGPAVGQNKRIVVTTFRIDEEGYEEIVDPSRSQANDGLGQIRTIFDVSWTVSMGGCNGAFELKGLSLGASIAPAADIHDQVLESWHEASQRIGINDHDAERLEPKVANAQLSDYARAQDGPDGIDWKARYRSLEFGLNLAKGEFERFRDRTIAKMLDALM